MVPGMTSPAAQGRAAVTPPFVRLVGLVHCFLNLNLWQPIVKLEALSERARQGLVIHTYVFELVLLSLVH